MSRKSIEVKTLHGYTIEQLRKNTNESANNYTRSMLIAVIIRYNGINTNDIMETLSKSRTTITTYINKWNQDPKNMVDQRGGSIPNRLTDEMVEETKTALQTCKPCECGYEQSSWRTALLVQMIVDKYGTKFSDEWIRKLLIKLVFSYKKGVYKLSKTDPELQRQFKKNLCNFGYI